MIKQKNFIIYRYCSFLYRKFNVVNVNLLEVIYEFYEFIEYKVDI